MSDADRSFQVRPLLTMPPGSKAQHVTSDGHVFGMAPGEGGRFRFVWDGSLGEPFDERMSMRDGTVGFPSDDGRHVAVMARRGTEFFVQRDGTELGGFKDLSRSVPPTFNADGSHLAFGARRDGVMRLYLDGVETGEHEVAPIAAVFSPNGDRFAFAEIRNPGSRSVEYRIVVDGQPGSWFQGLRNARGALQFSPDGRRFAFYQVDRSGGARWVVDGIEQRRVDDTRQFGLAQLRGIGVLEAPLPAAFSPDSRRFAYEADVEGKGVAVVENDVPGPLVRGAGVPVFSPDSRHLAYLVQSFSKRIALVLDGSIGREWEGAGGGLPVFSPDGRRVAISCWRTFGLLGSRRAYWITVDGRAFDESEGEDVSLRPVFSWDSERLAWWIKRGDATALYVDGAACPFPMDDGDFAFLADGRVAYPARVGAGRTIAVGDRPGPIANQLSSGLAYPTYPVTPDGLHTAWAGVFADGARPVIDDRVGPAFDRIIARRADADAVTWWAARGDVIFEAVSPLAA